MNSIFKKQTKLIIIISFLCSLGLISFVAFNANRYINVMQSNNRDLFDAFKISEILKSFKNNIVYIENKQRSFLITGDNKFFDEYKLKESETKSYLKQLEKYFENKPERNLFEQLNELTYQKTNQAKDLFASYSSLSGNSGAAGLVSMADVLEVIEQINESQNSTSQILINNSISYVEESKKYAFLEIIIGFLVALTAVVILFRDVNVRNKLEKDLFIAKQRADNIALMKEQFMANMSHEIRTPMNAIIGFSDLLMKAKLNNSQQEYAYAIKTSSENLLNIVNDILDFSKIEAGQLKIERIEFDIYLLFNNLKLLFDKRAEEKGISLLINMDNTIPKILIGDPNRLMQVLINLTNNAIKFTEQGNVTIGCTPQNITKAKASLVFTVSDTGVGIPLKKQAQIFERFNQGDAETTRKFGGTGLGLAIVKSLIELQQGTVKLKSEEGKGSQFYVELTYDLKLENTASKAAVAYNQMKFERAMPYKILLAEDNLLNQKLAATVLRNFNLDVVVTDNGAEAINKIKQSSFDLILLDIQMPIMDGYTAARIIRNELKYNMPIVAMTANVLPTDIQKCLAAGMNDYITKPFKEQELYNVLAKNLKAEMANSESKTPNNGDAIDLKDLYELANGNTQFIAEMMEIFLEQNPKELELLRIAINNNATEQVQHIAHKMKSAVGFMGVKNTLEALNQLEDMGEMNKLSNNAGLLFEQVKANCLSATISITNELNKIKNEQIPNA
jgi:signal transduction histidine kinase/DNA-binding response OmpR family regulator